MTDEVTPAAAPGGTALGAGGREPKTESHPTSIAVWGVPSPVVVNSRFAATVGVKCSAGCPLGGRRVVIRDAAGADVGQARLGESPEAGTGALYAAQVGLTAPAVEGVHTWTAAFGGAEPGTDSAPTAVSPQRSARRRAAERDRSGPLAHGRHAPSEHAGSAESGRAQQTVVVDEAAAATFGFRTVAPPEHRVTVTVVDQDTRTPLAGAEVRVGIYRGTTDSSGHAHVEVRTGSYDLYVRKAGYKPHADTVPVVSGNVVLQVATARVSDADLDDEQVWM